MREREERREMRYEVAERAEMKEKIFIDITRAMELVDQAIERMGEDFIYNVEVPLLSEEYLAAGPVVNACMNIPLGEARRRGWRESLLLFPDSFWPQDHPKRKTGCLIGTALTLAGVKDLPVLGAIATVAADLGSQFQLTNGAYAFFVIAQQMQDAGKTWGAAREAATEGWSRFYPSSTCPPDWYSRPWSIREPQAMGG